MCGSSRTEVEGYKRYHHTTVHMPCKKFNQHLLFVLKADRRLPKKGLTLEKKIVLVRTKTVSQKQIFRAKKKTDLHKVEIIENIRYDFQVQSH